METLFKPDDTNKQATDFSAQTEIVALKSHMLKVSDSIQIKPLSDNSDSVQYYVKYLGGLEKKSLICTLPMEDDKVVFIKENTAYALRLFSGKNVYAFNAIVEIVYSRPYPHLHFKYPREVTVSKIRRNQRVDVSIIAAVTNVSDTEQSLKCSGLIENISMRGLLFKSAKPAGEVDDNVECAFKFKQGNEEAVFTLIGKIRNLSRIKLQSGNSEFTHGIEFGEIPLHDKALLQNYIFEQITGEKIENI